MKTNRRLTASRAAQTLAAVLLVLALAGVGAAIQLLGSQVAVAAADSPSLAHPSLSETLPVTIDTTELRLACPPGTVDPLELGTLADEASTWVSAGAGGAVDEKDLQGLGSIILPGTVTEAVSFPTGISVAGVVSGDARGLLVGNCQVPANQLALVGGSTMVGEDTFLTLVNPNPRPVDVNLTGYGAGGELDDLAQPLTIPPETSVVWMPAPWFPDEDRLGLLVDATGGGVAAWLQSSGRDGEVPLGLSRLAGASLDEVNVFPGISESDGAWVMRVLNPSDQVITVNVSTIDGEGERGLPGGSGLQVDPGAVFEIGLEGIGQSPVTVVARGDAPFSAGLSSQTTGTEHPLVKDKKVESRTLLGPVVATEALTVPNAPEIVKLTKERDFTDTQVALTLANPGDHAVTVTGAETVYELAPGTSRTLTPEETAALPPQLLVEGKVYAALAVSAGTDLGSVQAIFGLGFGGFTAITRTVVLSP